MIATEGQTLAMAVIDQPLDAVRRLAFADWLDEHDDHQEAALQRVIAEPKLDQWRLMYADILASMGSDYALQAMVIQVMCAAKDLFTPRPWDDSWRDSLYAENCHNIDFVHKNLDLIAWSDLDLRTEAVPGSYIWNRSTGYGIDGEVTVSFSRGFVAEVQTDIDTFLNRASDIFRHPVESVRLGLRATYDERFVNEAIRAGATPTPWTWLPAHIETRRAVGRLFPHLPRVWFETQEQAEAALNEACLTLGRRAADSQRFLAC